MDSDSNNPDVKTTLRDNRENMNTGWILDNIKKISFVRCDNGIVIILKSNPYLLEPHYNMHYVEFD